MYWRLPIKKLSASGIGLLICLIGFTAGAQPRLVPLSERDAISCLAIGGQSIPDFSGPTCRAANLYEVDPQNQSIWVQTQVEIPETWLTVKRPLALFIYAKSSSAVYVNGEFIGRNGIPALLAEEELAGVIDKAFYIPASLIKKDNEIVIHFSSHHGFLDLVGPIHFVGLGDYAAPESLLDRYTGFSMMLLGGLILATLYFLVLNYRSNEKNDYGLFVVMGVFASVQLSLEIVRGLYAYTYPLHDLRLILIALCAAGFGFCLLIFVARKLEHQHNIRWLGIAALTIGVVIWWTPGFDIKTAIAVLVPAIFATVMLGIQAYRTKAQEMIRYTATFIVFDIIIMITLTTFHHINYYLIIAAMTAYLFVDQARTFEQRRKQLLAERAEVEKLSFRLEQLQQQQAPASIVINSAGEVHHVPTNEVRLCKAFGDYVELHLSNGRMQLYSGTMKDLAERLPSTFIRVHRSYVVNLDYVTTLKSTAGSGVLILSEGEQVPVSRRLMPTVRDTLKTGPV